jgi:mannosyltransferase
MILFDNIIFSLQKAGGVSVVWHEMLKRIIEQKNIDCRFLEYENASENIFRQQLHIPPDKIIALKKNTLLAVERYLNPRVALLQTPFLFHSSYYRTTPNRQAINITTVHDFTYEYYSGGIKQKIHCRQKYNAIRKADIIICISENTKRDLLKFLPDVNPKKIHIVYNGVSDDYFPITDNNAHLCDSLPFPQQSYLLFVGSRTAYKRFDFAVETAKKFHFNLIITGGGKLTEKETDFLRANIPENSFKQLNNISNHQLNLLYNHAFCLIYPSEYEGFGIPVLEAQKAGCPVVAYNGSSIVEVVGDKTLLFDHFNPEDMTPKIDLLKNARLRQEIIDKGKENAQRFSWDKTYAELFHLYQNAFKQIEKSS